MKKFLFSFALILTACAPDLARPPKSIAHQELAEVKIHVGGMMSYHCENRIRTHIGTLEGVKSVTASHTKKEVIVTFSREEISLARIMIKIKELGYKARLHGRRIHLTPKSGSID